MENMKAKLPKFAAEAVGTFCLVFAGTGAVIVDAVSGGRVTPVGISLVFGFIVAALIYALGHISGAHFNPAVTMGFWASGRMKGAEAGGYATAQVIGAAAASIVLSFIFPGAPAALGATLPSGSWQQAFALEFIMTAMLMLVILGVAVDERAQGVTAGAAIGALIAAEALLGGPISGASMNPARSLGPALAAAAWRSHWVYWAAPLSGSLMGAWTYSLIRCPSSGPSDMGCC